MRPPSEFLGGRIRPAKLVANMSDHGSNKVQTAIIVLSLIGLQACESLGIHDTTSLLSPRFHRSEIVGLVAGLGTTFAGLPDLLAMLKRRSSAGMNPRMAGIMCAFQFAWVYYGLLIASRPVILWNVIAIVINGLSVGAYLYFVRRERNQAKQR
jgi:MtN3 and saliva related transmembrane protein